MSDRIKAMRDLAQAPFLKPGTMLSDGYGNFSVVTAGGGTEPHPYRSPLSTVLADMGMSPAEILAVLAKREVAG